MDQNLRSTSIRVQQVIKAERHIIIFLLKNIHPFCRVYVFYELFLFELQLQISPIVLQTC